MIARVWQGRVPREKLDAYLELMRTVALRDYRATEGNLGAWCLHRPLEDSSIVQMLTFWTSFDAIARFAGEELTSAKYYDFDPDFLLEMPDHVDHFAITDQRARSLNPVPIQNLSGSPQGKLVVDSKTEFDITSIMGLSPDIRYVAINRNGSVYSREGVGLENASAAESDKYEELIVNPTLLYLARQRGNIDCGGASFIVVGYGNFTQLIVQLPNGHASIGFEPGQNPLDYLKPIELILRATRKHASRPMK